MIKFNATYFKYDKKGNESIKTETAIGRKRLITLLETPSVQLDVYHVENHDTGKVYLNEIDGQVILLDDLKNPGVNNIFSDSDFT